jgi:hypothetical protein
MRSFVMPAISSAAALVALLLLENTGGGAQKEGSAGVVPALQPKFWCESKSGKWPTTATEVATEELCVFAPAASSSSPRAVGNWARWRFFD